MKTTGKIGSQKRFNTQKKCLYYLMSKKTQEQKTCKKCKREFKNFVQSEMRFSCPCGNKLNPKVGTIFEGTQIPLSVWFDVIEIFATSTIGVAAHWVHKKYNISYNAAWRMCKKIREYMQDDFGKFDGADIEIDETYIGGKEGNKHQNKKTRNSNGKIISNKIMVVAMLNRNCKQIIGKVVSNNKKTTIQKVINLHTTKNNRIYSDGNSIYENMFSPCMQHETVNHEQGEFVKNQAHTNTLENFWSLFKRGLRNYIFVSQKYLQLYLNEFIFRYNHRKENIFELILQKI